ncbi:MAG: 50S ribosomal protein L4 [Spirochaetia bacterium]
MKHSVVSTDGTEVRQIELPDEVFAQRVSEGSIYHAIRNELANNRVGTAKVKTRGEVAGSHKKPWRQKGTGRARAGTMQSPIRVGGGVAFGPRPRDYGYRMPKKAKRLAMKSILSRKAASGALVVVEDFEVPDGKTRNLAPVLERLTGSRRSVFIVGGDEPMIKRAGRNIAFCTVLSFNRLRAHDLFYGERVVVTESAVKALGDMYGRSPGAAEAQTASEGASS